jgi:hypothetical protein
MEWAALSLYFKNKPDSVKISHVCYEPWKGITSSQGQKRTNKNPRRELDPKLHTQS